MAMLAFVPAVPIPLVAGIVGAAYPFPVALFICLGGTIFGSICMFFLCRYVFQRIALKQVRKWQRLDGFFQLLERNGFLAVLIGRLIPIMPSAAINAIAGVTKVRFGSFLLATTIGKFPKTWQEQSKSRSLSGVLKIKKSKYFKQIFCIIH